MTPNGNMITEDNNNMIDKNMNNIKKINGFNNNNNYNNSNNNNNINNTKKNNNNNYVDTYLKLPKEIGTDYTFKRQIVWPNAIGFLMLHLAGVIGLLLARYAHPLTIIWSKYFLINYIINIRY